MATIFVVNGEEKTLEILTDKGIDWSADFIGNTSHGMEIDDEGRYIATQEDFDWWQKMIAKWEKMEEIVANYKERFGRDEVDQVINDIIGGYDLEDQPGRVIDALKDAFEIKHIKVEYDNEESAMYGSNGAAGINTEASEARFEQKLEAALKERYPEAEIEVVTGHGTTRIDGEKDHEERPYVDQILHNVWSEFDWLVAEDEEDRNPDYDKAFPPQFCDCGCTDEFGNPTGVECYGKD